MQNQTWQRTLQHCANPARAAHYYDALQGTGGKAFLEASSPEQARILAALFSGSEAMSELLLTRPEWLTSCLEAASMEHPRQKRGLQREIDAWLLAALEKGDYRAAFSKLREFKQREMVRIAARDLARLSQAPGIIQEISDVADVCLEAASRLCLRRLTERFGLPFHQDANQQWQPTAFCVIGLGKLGGQELNFSSDIDVIFLYSEEGNLFKRKPRKGQKAGRGLSNHQFFLRLAEMLIQELTQLAPEGQLFRVDLRLRPEGDAGPLARSLSSYENFYAQWGQTWERMMLLKARCVAGDVALGGEFLEMIQPFRYPRSLGENVLQEIASMKRRLETEVIREDEIERNVKLGRGGIREIEFIAQTLQLLNGGRIPFLQDPQTLSALGKLVRYGLMADEDSRALSEAYCFLRDVEHRLQMENNLQTHTIPAGRPARQKLAALMGFESLDSFETAKLKHQNRVRGIFDALLKEMEPPEAPLVPHLEKEPEAWHALLARHAFREPERGLALIKTFVHGPGYVHVSSRTSELALQLILQFLSHCPIREPAPAPGARPGRERKEPDDTPVLSDPDRVLARLDSFVTAYGSRAMLYEVWSRHLSLFGLLLLLFDRSEFLAERAIRTPDLVEDLAISGRLRRRKTAEEILQDLQYGLEDEDQFSWMRRYHQAELLRLGLRDILGLADFEQNIVELTALAEACLQYALEVVLRQHKKKPTRLAILGLGKLGGAELNYGSDLDILFVIEDGEKNLAAWQRVASGVLDLVSRQTEAGYLFETDARLRPDGEKGLLVNTLRAHEEYYRQRAQLWEIQALTRIRAVAGDQEIGRKFTQLADQLTNFRAPAGQLAAFRPNWRQEIHRMRRRIEKERTPPGQDHLAIKTGTGGLIDAEFLAQTLCLACGWREPNTIQALERGAQERALSPALAEELLPAYRKLRRVEGILRRWSYAGETVLPSDPAPLLRVAVRCGFASAEEFLQEIQQLRAAIRNVYDAFMKAG